MQLSQGFSPAIQSYVLASEGGYVDHPKDPGGATNHGITFKVLQAWRGRKITKTDVKNLTKDEAIRIYKAQYWDTMQCSKLPLGLDYMTLDYGINSGPARSIKDLQRTVGAEPDGVMGQLTIRKITEVIADRGIGWLLNAFAETRWLFVKSLKTFKTFGTGWKRRIWGMKEGIQQTDSGVVDRAAKISAARFDLVKMPVQSIGSALPEKPTYVDMLKDPTALTGVAGAAATVFGAVQNQPVIQIAVVLVIAFLVYKFVIQKKQESPT